jgi:serine protease
MKRFNRKEKLPLKTPSFKRSCIYVATLMVVTACGSGLDPITEVGSDPTNEYSVSGQVSVVESTALDSDTNDVNQQNRASNDRISTAQQLTSNLVTISGYLNMPGQGPQGANFSAGDIADGYAVRLEQDQVVELDFVSSNQSIDVDLSIYDDQNALVGASLGRTSYECIRISQTGDYTIGAALYQQGSSGGTLYQVRISAPGAVTQCPTTTNAQSMVIPGELVVKSKDASKLATKSNAGPRYDAKVLNGTLEAGQVALVSVPTDLSAMSGTAAVKGKSVTRSEIFPGEGKSERALEVERTLLAAKLMSDSDQFAYASVNERMQSYQTAPQLTGTYPSNDKNYFSQKWHYDAIDLPAAMAAINALSPKPTRRPIVAVLDTGIVSHPDLNNMLVPGLDAITDPTSSLDGNGVDSNPIDITSEGPGFTHFHGTHVGGTIAAESFNEIYGAGVAPMARLMTVRVLGKKGGTTNDIVQGMRWAAGLSNNTGIPGPAETADVFNLSLGGQGSCSAAFEDTFREVVALGKIIVVASGNESRRDQLTAVASPANCQSAVAVGATDARNGRSYYSNGGANLDVAAPGGDVTSRSTNTGLADGVASTVGAFSNGNVVPGFDLMQGTSMATPHVAGMLALMKYIAPGFTQGQFLTLLANGSLTTDIGAPGKDNLFGHGLMSAAKAVQEAQRLAGGDITQPVGQIQASPSSIAMGGIRSSAEFVLSSVGTTETTVTNVTSDSDVLSVTGTSVDQATGLGTYSITADRNRVADGQSLFAKVLVGLSDNTRLEIPVSVERSSGAGGTVGPVYILVIDVDASTTDTTEIAAQSSVFAPTNGRYDYTVPQVPGSAARIAVFAGTDLDNDGLICDQGEACGAFPVLGSQTEIIEPNGANQTGVDFAVQAQTGLDGTASMSTILPTNSNNQSAGIARLR